MRETNDEPLQIPAFVLPWPLLNTVPPMTKKGIVCAEMGEKIERNGSGSTDTPNIAKDVLD